MPTGIIYKATNLINGKCYIGQTIKSLNRRKSQHYADRFRKNYKFMYALRKYREDDWTWDVVEENIPVDELNTKETYYISQFNSFHKGYNALQIGESHPNRKHNARQIKENSTSLYKNKTIYSVYHYLYGTVSATKEELVKIEPKFSKFLIKLIQGTQRSVNLWVLSSNTDKYNEYVNVVNLTHKEHGIHSLPAKEFYRLFNIHPKYIYRLKTQTINRYKGWELVHTT